MFKIATKISRPNDVVWTYFTTPETWNRWYGGGLTKVEPAWQKGAKLHWELGGSSIVADFVDGQRIVVAGSWMDTTYTFVGDGGGTTVVEILQSDPKGGASFSDGGAANKAECEKTLARLKASVESETAAPERKPEPIVGAKPEGDAEAKRKGEEERAWLERAKREKICCRCALPLGLFDRLLRRTSHPGCGVPKKADVSAPPTKAGGSAAAKPDQHDKRWVPGQGTTVFAFKALTPEAGAMAMFGRVVTISSGDLVVKIRREAQSPEADVKLLEPGEWNAPQLPGLSQNYVVGAYPVVVARAGETLRTKFGIDGLNPQKLTSMGAGAMPHPSGHVLFLFKIPGRLVPRQPTS